MQTAARIEGALEQAVALASASGAPPLLAGALRYAVFPAGHRIRPQLCLAVAQACGDPDPVATDAAADPRLRHALRVADRDALVLEGVAVFAGLLH